MVPAVTVSGVAGVRRDPGKMREGVQRMEFETEYEAFMQDRQRGRTGLAAQRLENGLGHAEHLFLEKVWWPGFHHFDNLYPEYEVADFKDTHRYIDFAYIKPHFKIAIEIDGFGSHWQDITQQEFIDHLRRQNDLLMDHWQVLRFAFEEVRGHPRSCLKTITQMIAIVTADVQGDMAALSVLNRAIVQQVMAADGPVTARGIQAKFGFSDRTASRHLINLAKMGWLEPVSGVHRFHAYRMHPKYADLRL